METLERQLTGFDRCDRCGAQAYVMTMHANSNLLWCAHDFNNNLLDLTPFVILDERWRLES